MYDTPTSSRRLGRSIAAILAGVAVNIVLALLIDELFHRLDVYPPWGEPMTETADNALALSYRMIIAVLGGYVTARLAPSRPMRHAIILGVIGTFTSFLGLLGAMAMPLWPLWYPITLVVIAFPCTWFGGSLAARTDRR